MIAIHKCIISTARARREPPLPPASVSARPSPAVVAVRVGLSLRWVTWGQRGQELNSSHTIFFFQNYVVPHQGQDRGRRDHVTGPDDADEMGDLAAPAIDAITTTRDNFVERRMGVVLGFLFILKHCKATYLLCHSQLKGLSQGANCT